MSKLLRIVDTDYREDIMYPYCRDKWPSFNIEMYMFLKGVNEAFPGVIPDGVLNGKDEKVDEPSKIPPTIVTENDSGKLEYNPNSFVSKEDFNAGSGEGIAALIDGLVTGKHAYIQQNKGNLWSDGKVPEFGFIVNTAGNDYDPVFEILQNRYNYELKRVTVNKKSEGNMDK